VKFLSFVFVFSFFVFFFSLSSSALSLGVSPPSLSFEEASPGEKEVTVFNPSDKPVLVTSRVVDFRKDEKGKLQDLWPAEESETALGSSYYLASRWVTVDPAEFVLYPQDQKKVRVIVNMPPQGRMEPGEKYFGILFVGSPQGTEGMVQFQDSILCQAFVSVSGERRVAFEIERPRVPKLVFGNRVDYSVRIKNTGNTHLDFRDLFLLFRAGDKEIARENLGTPLLLPVVPGLNEIDFREIDGTVRLPNWPRRYKVKAQAGYPLQATSEEIVIWVIPWWLVGVVGGLIVVLFAFFSLRFWGKRRKGKGDASSKKGEGK
jgi:P pilus assembly chaperone PapD